MKVVIISRSKIRRTKLRNDIKRIDRNIVVRTVPTIAQFKKDCKGFSLFFVDFDGTEEHKRFIKRINKLDRKRCYMIGDMEYRNDFITLGGEYLRMPIKLSDLKGAIDCFKESVSVGVVVFREDTNESELIYENDIVCLECHRGRYCIYTMNDVFPISRLSRTKLLDATHSLMNVSRSYFVNMNYVLERKGQILVMYNHMRIPISRTIPYDVIDSQL